MTLLSRRHSAIGGMAGPDTWNALGIPGARALLHSRGRRCGRSFSLPATHACRPVSASIIPPPTNETKTSFGRVGAVPGRLEWCRRSRGLHD